MKILCVSACKYYFNLCMFCLFHLLLITTASKCHSLVVRSQPKFQNAMDTFYESLDKFTATRGSIIDFPAAQKFLETHIRNLDSIKNEIIDYCKSNLVGKNNELRLNCS